MHFLGGCALVLALLAGFQTVTDAVQPTQLRVVALGDSITAGGFTSHGAWKVGPGYRWDLAQMSNWIGSNLQFVGTLKDGPWPATQAHEGHSGKRVEEIRDLVRGKIAALQPDVILLLAGTNDILQGYQLKALPERLLFFIDQLQKEAPNAHLLIGIPPPTNNTTYNRRLKTLEATLLSSRTLKMAHQPPMRGHQPKVKILNFFQKAKISPMDLTDGIHMTPSGNKKLADHWAKGLRCILRNLDCEFL